MTKCKNTPVVTRKCIKNLTLIKLDKYNQQIITMIILIQCKFVHKQHFTVADGEG